MDADVTVGRSGDEEYTDSKATEANPGETVAIEFFAKNITEALAVEVQAEVDKRQFFRVRLGPIASVEHADQLLELLQSKGFADARVIVD